MNLRLTLAAAVPALAVGILAGPAQAQQDNRFIEGALQIAGEALRAEVAEDQPTYRDTYRPYGYDQPYAPRYGTRQPAVYDRGYRQPYTYQDPAYRQPNYGYTIQRPRYPQRPTRYQQPRLDRSYGPYQPAYDTRYNGYDDYGTYDRRYDYRVNEDNRSIFEGLFD